jgi:spermidine synthase
MPKMRIVLFALFVASGFCSLLYQVVWLRLAFAAFGIVTPVLSVVLSVFMLGLALGSWLAGRLAEPLAARTGLSAAALYGLAEWGIGAGAFIVPAIFTRGENLLLGLGETSSGSYLALSALLIAAAVLGFAILMGMTFPLMMAFIRAARAVDAGSFSFLYLGNVIGAMAGASLSALVLIEMFGFRGTLALAAFVNVAIGAVAILLGRGKRPTAQLAAEAPPSRRTGAPVPSADTARGPRLTLLFVTGFASLAMEVVWTRAFTPVLQTTIYAFAALLTVYLLATWLGSAVYRAHLARGRVWGTNALLGALSIAALLPLVLNDPRWHHSRALVLLSIMPLSALLGYLTPRLVDDHSQGEPRAAGLAYAVNVLGCIVGPLVAGYALLPWLGVKWSLILLALAFGAFFAARMRYMPVRPAAMTAAAGAALLLLGAGYTTTYEDPGLYERGEVRRDYAATVVSAGTGMQRQLLVNGIGITVLTPITKFMAHLPLVYLPQPPRATLVICFGMGTTFRSLSAWEGRTTAVELVPGVRDAFGYYFSDAAQVLTRPGKQIVIDDGRRFLTRTGERFDLVTLDPPPPVEAAGSSLLYSVEFYRTLRERLAPGGILQQWFPGGEPAIERAVLTSLRAVFPQVKVFHSIEGWGYHFLASDRPLTSPGVEQALARMPAAATLDLMEWYPGRTPREVWQQMLKQEFDPRTVAPEDSLLGITDNRPFNEYYLLRRLLQRARTFLERTL